VYLLRLLYPRAMLFSDKLMLRFLGYRMDRKGGISECLEK